jgi:glutamate 5-kinase
MQRESLKNARKIVVKVGTHILGDKTGKPNRMRIASLVRDLTTLHHEGREIILVTSGAIGTGMHVLGKKRTSTTPLPDLQMTAAIGQTRLMQLYHNYFAKGKCLISQVLLTHDDLRHRQRHLNARNAILNLLNHRVIPIVNENDVVAVDEIRVGDNDFLSAMVATLINADLLILLTSPNGFYMPNKKGKMQRVSYLETINDNVLKFAKGKTSSLSTGGMVTKLKAAKMATQTGTQVIIASGLIKGIIKKIIQGDDVGTYIGKHPKIEFNSRKRWIAFFHKPQGTLTIDLGAEKALISGKSLLPIGIKAVDGNFASGVLVTIQNTEGNILGQGLVSYNSNDIKKILGHRAGEIEIILGDKKHDEIIHHDNLILEKL